MNMWPSQLNRNLSNCEVARRKVFQGFNGIEPIATARAALLYQLSYEDPYTGSWPIHWVHQPVKGMKHRMKWCKLREYKWNEYVTIAVELQFKQLRISQEKFFRGFNGIDPSVASVLKPKICEISWHSPFNGNCNGQNQNSEDSPPHPQAWYRPFTLIQSALVESVHSLSIQDCITRASIRLLNNKIYVKKGYKIKLGNP